MGFVAGCGDPPEMPHPLAAARAMPPSSQPEVGRAIALTDGLTGRPLASASLILMDNGNTSPELRRTAEELWYRYPDDPTMAALAIANRFGVKLVTDLRGRAMIPDDFRGTMHIVAGAVHDHVSIAESYDAEVAVYGRRQVTVDLVHANGEPAIDVEVQIRYCGNTLYDGCAAFCRSRTDALGRAQIELPPFTLRGVLSQPLVLQAMVCGADAEASVELDAKRYRRGDPGPVRLTLPPLARLRVTALDGNGDRRQFHVSVAVVEESPGASLSVSEFSVEAAQCFVTPERSYRVLAHFPHQIGGQELSIRAPAAGEVVAAEFDARTAPMTVAVQLTSAGEPVAGRRVYCQELMFLGDGGVGETDGAGRVWIALAAEQLALGRLTLALQEGPALRSLGAVEVALPPAVDEVAPIGIHDLGSAALQQEPILLSGRVLDEAGVPVAGAYVQRCFANSPCMHPSPVRTDESGRFELRMLNPFPAWAIALRPYPSTVRQLVTINASQKDKGSWPAWSDVVALRPNPSFEVGADVEIVLRR